jgi:hypothetical protein
MVVKYYIIRRHLLFAAFAFQASALCAQSAGAVTYTVPAVLNPGATVSPVQMIYSGTVFTSNFAFHENFSFTKRTIGHAIRKC